MGSSLNIFIPTNFYVYETCLGLNYRPVVYVNLLVKNSSNYSLSCNNYSQLLQIMYNRKSNILSTPDLYIDKNEIIKIFNKNIGANWKNKTLFQKGMISKYVSTPIEYVDFSPSLDNLALYIYNTMKPTIQNKTNYTLEAVELVSSGYIARYCA